MLWFDENGNPQRESPTPRRRSVVIPCITLILGLSGLAIAYTVLSNPMAVPATIWPSSQPMSIPYQLTVEAGQATQISQSAALVSVVELMSVKLDSPTPTQPPPTQTPKAFLALPTCGASQLAVGELCIVPMIPRTAVPRPQTPTPQPCSLTTPSVFSDKVCKWDA